MVLSQDREAQFLESRAQRLANKGTPHNRERVEQLQAFWSIFRQQVGQWQQRLETLQAEQQIDGKSLSEKRNHLRAALADLQAELEALRKHCLSTDAGGSSGLEWDVPADIPATDLRLLHGQLTECATQLENAKESYLPKHKFVFKRYRQAMQKQQQNQTERHPKESSNTNIPQLQETKPQQQSSTIPESAEKPDNPLENQSYVSLHVSPNGEVGLQSIQHQSNAKDGSVELLSKAIMVDRLSSPVMRNVHHSKVVLGQDKLDAFHVSHVSNSTIRATQGKVSGAIHITKCQNVHVYLHSFHQLRIHESSMVHFHIAKADTAGGIILEDCSNLVFHVDATGSTSEGDVAKVLDIKDFNWLRNGVPSPNYRMEPETEESLPEDPVMNQANNPQHVVPAPANDPNTKAQVESVNTPPVATNPETPPMEEDSDDDEL